jgi:hypothetical protein
MARGVGILLSKEPDESMVDAMCDIPSELEYMMELYKAAVKTAEWASKFK